MSKHTSPQAIYNSKLHLKNTFITNVFYNTLLMCLLRSLTVPASCEVVQSIDELLLGFTIESLGFIDGIPNTLR